MTDIATTLQERGTRYGEFIDNATIAQTIKQQMRASPKWGALQPDQQEALDQMASKIGRILTGDPSYRDSWVDIAGYATLISNRLTEG